MRDVAPPNVESPAYGLGICDDERVRAQLGDLVADSLELVRRRLARKFLLVQDDGTEGRRRTVVPDRIERIRIGGDKPRAGGGAGLGELFGALDRANSAARSLSTTVVPAEPVNPVSQASRSSDGGKYSF